MSEDLLPLKHCIVEVLLDDRLEKPLDYSVPLQFLEQIRPGLRVEIPVRNSYRIGTIFRIKNDSSQSLRSISRIIPEQSSSQSLWKLALWMSKYYCCSLQKVLKLFTPSSIRKDIRPKTKLRIRLAISQSEALKLCADWQSKQGTQAKVLETILSASRPILLSHLLEDLKISRSTITSLVKKKIIVLEPIVEQALLESDFFPTKAKALNLEQASCLDKIHQSMNQGTFAAHLIHGVTGSGKTEIYLQAIQHALDLGKSTILLVPEIALTSQTIERFRARFGIQLAIFHHRRSLGERTAAWESLQQGKVQIAIGARSAIFCPAQNLGLIIIDEEHDSSYKQSEEMPTYHARDVAVMRAKLEQAVVILGSATPSLESYTNCQSNKYILSHLKSRATSASMPKIKVVDMKIAFERSNGFTHFSPELIEAIQDRLEKGEQGLLLLNRRGFHRMQLCSNCRTIAKCPHCDISLTFHREANILQCHLCNFQVAPYRECPVCRCTSSMEFRGFGTEHVERSLHALFPEIRTLRMDRDTTRRKESHEELFKQFRAHKADILIGTQMIAKGFHFPSVTLVGVLNADASLQIPDFRSSENIFQLLTQVAGRAGREDLKGEVILQTFLPDHPILRLASSQDYNAFYEREIEERKQFSFPPFCRLIKLVFIGSDEKETCRVSQEFYQMLLEKAPSEAQFLPPLPSGHPKIKDQFRFQFLIKTNQIPLLSERIDNLRKTFSFPKKLFLLIDVDPISTFF